MSFRTYLAVQTKDNLVILKDMIVSQEIRAAAHVELDDDTDLANLIANLFTLYLLEGLPVHDRRANAECAHSPCM